MLRQPARLDLQTSESRTALRPFHGHFTDVVRLGANSGFARYRLILEPRLAFLGHNRDSYLFQDQSVIEIVDELLGDWRNQGQRAPDWRWDLADASLYPKRGMTVQYQESDLAFLKRLLAEEGLFCWFAHQAAARSACRARAARRAPQWTKREPMKNHPPIDYPCSAKIAGPNFWRL